MLDLSCILFISIVLCLEQCLQEVRFTGRAGCPLCCYKKRKAEDCGVVQAALNIHVVHVLLIPQDIGNKKTTGLWDVFQ
jgi:hypothetical protein